MTKEKHKRIRAWAVVNEFNNFVEFEKWNTWFPLIAFKKRNLCPSKWGTVVPITILLPKRGKK